MGVALTTGQNDYRRRVIPIEVYTRAAWGDAWTLRENLYCDYVEFAASPSFGQAQFTWRYGRGQQPDAPLTRRTHARLEINGHYVRVDIDVENEADTNSIPAWFGRIVEAPDVENGVTLVDGVRVPHGVQTFLAIDLAAELAAQPILSSRVADAAGDAVEIFRAVSTNQGQGQAISLGDEVRGNRSPVPGTEGYQLFSRTLAAAEKWSAGDFIEYLLHFYAPKTAAGGDPFSWEFDPLGQNAALSSYVLASMSYDGKAVRDVLDSVFDRRRGFGWHVTMNEEQQRPQVSLFTYASDLITLPSKGVITPNLSRYALDTEGDRWVERLELRPTLQAQVDQVIARGARVGSVFTVSAADGTLVKDWTDAQEEDYNDAASGEADYAALEDWQKQQRNSAWRLDERLQRVYSWFRLPADWDVLVKDGENGPFARPAFPRIDPETGNQQGEPPQPTWIAGLRFERYLPLLSDHDYTADTILPELASSDAPDESETQRRAPLVALKVGEDARGDIYCEVHKIGSLAASVESDAADATDLLVRSHWSAAALMQEHAPGLIVNVGGGGGRALQHKLASADFAHPDAADKLDNAAELDWNDNLLATVYALGDYHVEQRYPRDDALPDTLEAGQIVRQLLIQVDDAHLDYVAPQTVVDLHDGRPRRTELGGWIRDDRVALGDLARIAYEWYSVERNAVTASFRRVRRLLNVGDFITSLGQAPNLRTVNTVVTRVRYDFAAGRTILQTSAAELDVMVS